MKYEILKQEISKELLDMNIDYYFDMRMKNPQYIIMHDDTLTSLIHFFNDSIEQKEEIDKSFKVSYHGIPIAICNHLKWGEIELV